MDQIQPKMGFANKKMKKAQVSSPLLRPRGHISDCGIMMQSTPFWKAGIAFYNIGIANDAYKHAFDEENWSPLQAVMAYQDFTMGMRTVSRLRYRSRLGVMYGIRVKKQGQDNVQGQETDRGWGMRPFWQCISPYFTKKIMLLMG